MLVLCRLSNLGADACEAFLIQLEKAKPRDKKEECKTQKLDRLSGRSTEKSEHRDGVSKSKDNLALNLEMYMKGKCNTISIYNSSSCKRGQITIYVVLQTLAERIPAEPVLVYPAWAENWTKQSVDVPFSLSISVILLFHNKTWNRWPV